jgi:hypothetical protein
MFAHFHRLPRSQFPVEIKFKQMLRRRTLHAKPPAMLDVSYAQGIAASRTTAIVRLVITSMSPLDITDKPKKKFRARQNMSQE